MLPYCLPKSTPPSCQYSPPPCYGTTSLPAPLTLGSQSASKIRSKLILSPSKLCTFLCGVSNIPFNKIGIMKDLCFGLFFHRVSSMRFLLSILRFMWGRKVSKVEDQISSLIRTFPKKGNEDISQRLSQRHKKSDRGTNFYA